MGLINREAINKATGFLTERVAAVQSLALDKEQFVVAMLVVAIPRGQYG